MVSAKLVMVAHSLSDDLNQWYVFTNAKFCYAIQGRNAKPLSQELVYFPIPQHVGSMKARNLKIPTKIQPAIILGYGNGQMERPRVKLGVASPSGWTSIFTENGDCSSPVMTDNGEIIGFWTHGNNDPENPIGKFEVVTEEIISALKEVPSRKSSNKLFRLTPLQ